MGSPFFILLFWFILFLKGKLSPVHLRAAAASGSYYWLMMNRLQSSGHCGCVDGASFWSRSRCSIVISGPHNSSFNTTPLSLSLFYLCLMSSRLWATWSSHQQPVETPPCSTAELDDHPSFPQFLFFFISIFYIHFFYIHALSPPTILFLFRIIYIFPSIPQPTDYIYIICRILLMAWIRRN